MRLTERRENGGKRKWRQIRQENFKREIRKKEIPKREMDTAGSMKPGKPPSGKYDFVCLAERVRSDIQNHFSGLPAVCDGLFHSWIGRSHTAFRLRLKGTAKKKNRQKPVKAPLWHKHKRNGPCIISLNCCLGVRQNPFLTAYAIVGTRSFKTCCVRWCADTCNRFYGKTCMRRKKLGRFISKSPVLLLLLHTKSSLKVTQCAEG